MFVVKHNIPTKTFLSEERFSHKRDALNRFRLIEKWCIKMGFPVKSFLRENANKPLRATIQTEVDNFTYYVELYAQ
jgi:hypothetical protein